MSLRHGCAHHPVAHRMRHGKYQTRTASRDPPKFTEDRHELFDVVEGERAQYLVERLLRKPIERRCKITRHQFNRKLRTSMASKFNHLRCYVERMNSRAVSREMFAANSRSTSCVEDM